MCMAEPSSWKPWLVTILLPHSQARSSKYLPKEQKVVSLSSSMEKIFLAKRSEKYKKKIACASVILRAWAAPIYWTF